MMSQDNRLLPLSAAERALERPLSDAAQPKSYGAAAIEPTNLREYLFVVLKRKWLILSLMLVVTSLVTIQMYRQPSIYEAETEVQIEAKTKSVLQTKEIVINAQSDPTYWATQLKLLENPALARQVVLTLDLQNNPAFFGGQSQTSLFDSLRRIFSRNRKPAHAPAATSGGAIPVLSEAEINEQQLTPEELAKLEPYEDTIAANLTVEPEAGTSLVKLKYKHPDPDMAKKIVNTLANVFVKNNLDRETQGTTNASTLLAKQIADLQLRIQQEEEKRLNYAREHNLPTDINNSPDANLEEKRRAAYSSDLIAAENARKEAQAKYYAAANSADPNAIPEVRDDQRIQKLRETLDRLQQKKAELLVIYTPEWPEVKKVDEQIKPIQAALDKAPKEVVASLKSKYEAAVAHENSINESYRRQTGITTAQSQAQIELSILMQNLETDKQSYNILLQRQRELQISGNDKPNNVRVTDYGKLPREPIGPPRLRNIAIAFLLSLLAGIGLAFLLDYLDDSLKSVEDVDRYIHLPALALIPARGSDRMRLKGRGAGDGSESTALALIDDARSPVAESYRHLRTSLLLSSAGQPPKSILVTSSQPSEGKTTTAVNTAVMLAQTGAEVVIIDCDLRRPRLHAHFGISNARGVTNYLSGESNIEELLQPYEKLPNLKLLPSGPVPPNPAELLGSEEMRKLITRLGEPGRFNHIVIDSPPAISFTDASILSTLVDGVMLVVHGGRSSRAVVRRAKQQLMDVGAHIFGVVLNNVKLESQDYYYSGYYSGYYADTEDDAPDAEDASAGAGR